MNDKGEMNILLLPLIFAAVFFVVAAGFSLWAYQSREDYRTNTNQKIDAAVKVARQDEGLAKDKQHAEDDKQPLKTYVGPEQFGSIHVSYPKTWSGYVSAQGSSNTPLDAYFQPGVVPGVQDTGSTYALRVQVINQSYSSVVTRMNQAVTTKQVTATAFAFPKVPNVVGVRYDGTIQQNLKITGSMIIVPIRDKTLQIWTESPVYADDYNKFVLPNITFSP
jgi:hypothetical protein